MRFLSGQISNNHTCVVALAMGIWKHMPNLRVFLAMIAGFDSRNQ